MQHTLIATSSLISRLKQQARKLKREGSLTHTQALDEVAKAAGFNHWHHVIQSNKPVSPAEEAFSSGFIVAFDQKDGMDVNTEDGTWIEDIYLEKLTEKSLFQYFSNLVDEDDPKRRILKDTCGEAELRDEFQEFNSFIFFRLNSAVKLTDPLEVLELLRKYCFWLPEYMWNKGRFIEVMDL